jgi:hypothetical protein
VSPEPWEILPELDIRAPERQRRWTVLLRLVLLIPHVIWMSLLGIAAAVVAVLGWFGALFLGRLPAWSARFLSGYVVYYTRVYAYSYLLVDRYPPFAWRVDDYPVRITLNPGRLNRWAVFFRVILAIPAIVVADVVGAGWAVLSFFIWLVVLVIGRVPVPVFGATAAVARYEFRFRSYFLMLTSAYPKRLFGDPPDAAPHSDTRPLVLTGGARVLLIAFIVLGVFGMIGGSDAEMTNRQSPSATATGP